MVECSNRPLGSHFLRSVHIGSFGKFSQRNVGPFAEGLNVVFGANESGKTTTSLFIGGVLFGWEDGRSRKNTYKPANAEQAGILTFAPRAGTGGPNITCMRERNTEGIKPDPHPAVLEDIDKSTYQTIFSLDSDELNGLSNADDVTAHLLTAGAGTANSPARVLEELDKRLAECLSRSASFPDSIVNIQQRQAQLAQQLDEASQEAKRFKTESREHAELQPQRDELAQQLEALNAEVSTLAASSKSVEHLLEQQHLAQDEYAALEQEEQDIAIQLAQAQEGQELAASLDSAHLRALRADLEDLGQEQVRLEADHERAQDAYSRAKIGYESAVGSARYEKEEAAARRGQMLQRVSGLMLPSVVALIGFYFLVHYFAGGSSLELGVGLCALLAAGLLFAFAQSSFARSRNTQTPAQLEISQARDALDEAEQELAVQDQKREQFEQKLAQTLEMAGLASVSGNVRLARAMLEDAQQAQGQMDGLRQRATDIAQRKAMLESQLAATTEELDGAYRAAGQPAQATPEQLREAHAHAAQQRNQLQERFNEVNTRFGQLESELAAAKNMRQFDQLKLENAQLDTRLAEAKANYARLLLARRLVADSISQWEQKSQPEVYQQASRLLGLVTDGEWVKVSPDGQDGVVVYDAFGNPRDPMLLSLGTRQQLYLALRIALLMTAENVGRSIPVLCDDILVNFDNKRRMAAARALGELACVRQVILFTCHEEVVTLMQEACPGANLVALSV